LISVKEKRLLKSHSCGELRKDDVGTQVTLAGWVDRRRDHGGLIFIDLRDREGITQVVFDPETSADCHRTADKTRSEYVIQVSGEVSQRPKGTENPKLPTGDIEVIARSARILNISKTPPFYINEEVEVEEALRLRYRYLDLRRPRMKQNLALRHRVIKFIRDFMDSHGFMDIETSILTKSTPEGARDYLVPSRVQPGKFYALPQSPQQMKQLLMVAGVEKYYQIAKCFRDEDTRADRQPEFTQLDLEMSFIETDDVLNLMEELFTALVKAIKPQMKVVRPFPRLSFAQAMERYGTDKPDLRFGMELGDITEIAAKTEFAVFKDAIAEGGRVKGICAPGLLDLTRHKMDELVKMVQELGGKGLITIALGAEGGDLDKLNMEAVKSVAAKYLTPDQVIEMGKRLGARPGDVLLIVADKPALVGTILGELRLEMARRLKLAEPDLFSFAFIQEFPLLRWDEETGRWDSEHHPFTAPREEDIPLLDSTPEKVVGQHYDVVGNGYELGGGSIRIHTAELQRKIFRLLGYSDKEIDARFGHMLEAFQYGAPPHGGIALGLDRIVMLLAGEETIREVIAFPKNQAAADLTFGAPSSVSDQQLAELHLRLREER
jgi:aspartyl-tRNA synthetase